MCFQRLRNLVAVDPLSGELLWVRHDIPPGSEIFGDDQYVFVSCPRSRANVNGSLRRTMHIVGGARCSLKAA